MKPVLLIEEENTGFGRGLISHTTKHTLAVRRHVWPVSDSVPSKMKMYVAVLIRAKDSYLRPR